MAMMLIISGALIDIKLILKWSKWHSLFYCFAFPLWAALFLYSAFSEYEEIILKSSQSAFMLIAMCLIMAFLSKHGILCSFGGFILATMCIFGVGAGVCKYLLDYPWN